MSFRNLSTRNSYLVMRNRPRGGGDEVLWRDIYPRRVYDQVLNFAVENWVPIVVGIIAGIAAGALGFFLGQKYSTINVGKKMAEQAFDLLPKEIQKHIPESLKDLMK